MTSEELRALLHYNALTGTFRWLVDGRGSALRRGKVAGSLGRNGYRQIRVSGRRFYSHRLAWFHTYGEWPKGEIDHINGVRDDNRISNLREATNSQNKWNSSRRTKNKSGFKGVSWNRQNSRWLAQIAAGGRTRYIGYFDSPVEAHAAYCKAAAKLHGKFARFA